MGYFVQPGLFRIGNPTAESPVLVSANYKLSFDILRSHLHGLDAWILVLDSKGVNVWCAAGKGTFSTDELVHRITETGLSEIISHKKVIVPQLGATGVSAHKVKEACGFKVVFGPVRAADIPEFLANGNKASAEMRRVRFYLKDRLAVAPIELVIGTKYLFLVMLGFFILSGLSGQGYSFSDALSTGSRSALLLVIAYLIGILPIAILLPYLPGRAFSFKGAFSSLVVMLFLILWDVTYGWLFDNLLCALGWLLMVPAVASFLSMNYTGSSTFTSLSGVHKEMKLWMPVQIAGAVIGLGLWIGSRFI
jgi:acetyl-CoA decarbonylase/synthase complex subunit gamma